MRGIAALTHLFSLVMATNHWYSVHYALAMRRDDKPASIDHYHRSSSPPPGP